MNQAAKSNIQRVCEERIDRYISTLTFTNHVASKVTANLGLNYHSNHRLDDPSADVTAIWALLRATFGQTWMAITKPTILKDFSGNFIPTSDSPAVKLQTAASTLPSFVKSQNFALGTDELDNSSDIEDTELDYF